MDSSDTIKQNGVCWKTAALYPLTRISLIKDQSQRSAQLYELQAVILALDDVLDNNYLQFHTFTNCPIMSMFYSFGPANGNSNFSFKIGPFGTKVFEISFLLRYQRYIFRSWISPPTPRHRQLRTNLMPKVIDQQKFWRIRPKIPQMMLQIPFSYFCPNGSMKHQVRDNLCLSV